MNIHVLQGAGAILESQTIMSAGWHIVSEQSNSPIVGVVQDALVATYLLTREDCWVPLHIAMDCVWSIKKANGWRDLLKRAKNYYNEGFEKDGEVVKLFYEEDGEIEVGNLNNTSELHESLKHIPTKYSKRVKRITGITDKNRLKLIERVIRSRAKGLTVKVKKDSKGDAEEEEFTEIDYFRHLSKNKEAFKREVENTINYLENIENPRNISYKAGDLCVSEIPGRLLFSSILPSTLNYENKGVVIKDGIILPSSTALEKKDVAAKANSIFHEIWFTNPHKSMECLTATEQLCYNWLDTRGFSVGVSDCVLKSEELRENIADYISNLNEECEDIFNDPIKDEDTKEAHIHTALNSAMNFSTVFVKDNINKGEDNSFNVMAKSGAKGSAINAAQISGFIGQQNLGGKRLPTQLNEGQRTLSYFDVTDNSPASRGMVFGNYLFGLHPSEVIHHGVSGRRGLVDTAVQTADIGYVNKRIAKKTEDITVRLDGTLRLANTDKIISFLYGDDGFDAKHVKVCQGFPKGFLSPVDIHEIVRTLSRTNDDDCKHELIHLEDDVINVLFEYLKIGYVRYQTPVTEHVTSFYHDIFRTVMKQILVHPCDIPELYERIYEEFETSKVPYGDAVGHKASCSTGEPSTQLTLNTFHHVGDVSMDVTLGLPYYESILAARKFDNKFDMVRKGNIGSTLKPNDPTLKAKYEEIEALTKENINLPQSSDEYKQNRTRITQTRLEINKTLQKYTKKLVEMHISDIIDGVEMVKLRDDVKSSPLDRKRYDVFPESDVELTASKYWWYLFQPDIPEEYAQGDWMLKLQISTHKLILNNFTLAEVAEFLNNVDGGDRFFAVYSPDVIGEIHLYINFLDEDMELKKLLRIHGDEKVHNRNEDDDSDDDVSEDGDSDEDNDGILPKRQKKLYSNHNTQYFIMRDAIIPLVRDMQFSGIEGILSAKPVENQETKEWFIYTEGTNLSKVFDVIGDVLDKDNSVSNYMWEIYHKYGIMAARKFLFKEITKVISFGGTYVNPRHISLLVDIMTYTGTITPVTSNGIDIMEVGPIAKGVFEKAVKQWVESASHGLSDPLKGLSGCLMYGMLPNIGTGAVQTKANNRGVMSQYA